MTHSTIFIPHNSIIDFCQRWQIHELSLFGSALRPDFAADSDIDILATFNEDASWSLLAHINMQHELEEIFQSPIDFISRRALEESPNWIRRHAILNSARKIYPIDEVGYES